jgi:hypothetical protein
VAALADLTFKELLNGAIPDGFTYPVFLEVRSGGTAAVWDQNDMRLQLWDHDDLSSGTTSSALSFAVTQEYVVKVQIEVQDNFWINQGISGGRMQDLSAYITNPQSTWGRTLNSIDVELHNGNWISIDVDSQVDNIHHHRFGLNDANVTGEVINEDVRIKLLSVESVEDTEGDASGGLQQLYDRTQRGDFDTPFSRFELYGTTEWNGPKAIGEGDLWLDDDDSPRASPLWNISGGVLMEVKEGWWVKMNIMNEGSGFFQPLAAAMSLDPRLSAEDFSGRDSDFTITIYGGGVVFADPDDLHGASGVLGGPFYISTGTNGAAYAISERANQEFNFHLIEYGQGVDPHIDPVNQCEDGFVWDETTQSCVPIGGGNGGGGGDDPFDIFDNQDAPFDEEDGVVERLLKTFTFGVNSTFRAFEAVVEGAMLALPAIIVIVAAVIAANLVVSATKTGTEKAKQLIGKAGSMRQNMSIDIEGMD